MTLSGMFYNEPIKFHRFIIYFWFKLIYLFFIPERTFRAPNISPPQYIVPWDYRLGGKGLSTGKYGMPFAWLLLLTTADSPYMVRCYKVLLTRVLSAVALS